MPSAAAFAYTTVGLRHINFVTGKAVEYKNFEQGVATIRTLIVVMRKLRRRISHRFSRPSRLQVWDQHDGAPTPSSRKRIQGLAGMSFLIPDEQKGRSCFGEH